MPIKPGWEAVIGMEVHAQLATSTKIFCGCAVETGGEPNSNTCPVCLGLPGALPILNKQVIELGARAALALGLEIQETSIFARKNYFYPDLPKGYQISQYDKPFSAKGTLTILTAERDEHGHALEWHPMTVQIERMHRLAKLEHYVIRNVSYVVDRSFAECLEALYEPIRRGADLYTANDTRCKAMTEFGRIDTHRFVCQNRRHRYVFGFDNIGDL